MDYKISVLRVELKTLILTYIFIIFFYIFYWIVFVMIVLSLSLTPGSATVCKIVQQKYKTYSRYYYLCFMHGTLYGHEYKSVDQIK